MSRSLRLRRRIVPLRFKLLSIVITFCLLAALFPQSLIKFVPVVEAASPNIVISQAYGGGGATTGSPAYLNDYVELFNTSNVSVNISGWSLQYGSSTGQFASSASNLYVFPAGTSIGAGKYFLVKLGGAGTLGASFTADQTSGNLSMAATAGKVALANINTSLNCGATATPCALPDSRIVDVVSWGSSNNGEGGTTVNNGSNLDSAKGAVRKDSGCQDTDNNNNDFIVATITSPVATPLVPRTSATAAHICGAVTNNPPTITAPSNPITTVTQDAAAFPVNLSGTDDNNVFNWSATPGTGVASVAVTGGQGTGTVTYTVTLQSGFNGTATFTASLSDDVNLAVTQTVNIKVNPPVVVNNPPTITTPANPIVSTTQDAAPFTVILQGSDDGGVYNWGATPVTGVASAVVSAGQGTSNVTYTVTLQAGFTGTATFTASLSDNVNTPATQAVNINVTAPPPLDHIVISQIYGGGGNSGATYQNDYVELYNPTTSTVDVSGWSIQYAATTGTSWQAQPIGGPIQPGEYYLISLGSGGAIGAALPAANIIGSINMSGTTGKVALVSNGTALSGNAGGAPLSGTTCPASSSIVDFVGYGTATCHEGGTDAPAPSNTTSIFRKNGGFTDTNVNGSDFQTGAPNPRRTAIITELGPWVSSTNPGSNFTNIPRDATIEVTFSEPVDAVGSWLDITCANTVSHNDGTTSHSNDFKTWAFTPNSNFQYGEQCTFTVNKDAIHDQDTDDSNPNTDTLVANYVSSFTVLPQSSAAPAPYPPSVHLTMGNPTNATADLSQPDNYLMEKDAYALSYNRSKGTPNWVSWHLDNSWYGNLTRLDTFRADPAVPADWYRVQSFDYGFSGFDRGHMTPNADRDNPASVQLNQATFLMSNMVPQAPNNNQGPWGALESYLRTLTDAGNEIYIVSGPAGVGGTGSNGFATSIADGHITVPAYTWKVALILPKQNGDDISHVTCATRTIAVIMPNTQNINSDWRTYLTSVDAVEQLSGYNLFSNLPEPVQTCVEAGKDGFNPPGAADAGYTTAEDSTVNITMTGYASSADPITYNIISGPTHGTLSPGATAADRVYTPAADFNGIDTFTFSISEGTLISRTATVTILVNEVNDLPTAADDNKATDEDTVLTFSASDLTTNDSAGPASESGQTLTVASVSATDNTHGTVGLNGGLITYTPEANFNGPASFTYSVCDNGTTAGSSDSKCAPATVNVQVNPVNDAPVLSNVPDLVSIPELSPYTFTASASDVDSTTLIFSLVNAPDGASITQAGQFNWTPSETQGGASYSFSVRVSDGTDHMDAPITINVAEVNQAPSLAAISARIINLGDTLSFTAEGADTDIPAQTLTYSLVGPAPAGAVISPTGAFSWTPSAAQAGIYTFTVKVTDNGSPNLSAEQQFKVTVAYTWSGALAPINGDGSSVFKSGRTIPVKFKLTGASAGISTAVARLSLAKVTDTVVGAPVDADATGGANDGNLFRYDPTADQYIFNLNTKGLSPGTYRLSIDMGDGVQRYITFGLN